LEYIQSIPVDFGQEDEEDALGVEEELGAPTEGGVVALARFADIRQRLRYSIEEYRRAGRGDIVSLLEQTLDSLPTPLQTTVVTSQVMMTANA